MDNFGLLLLQTILLTIINAMVAGYMAHQMTVYLLIKIEEEDYRERNVLTMCYINDMKFEDIAEKLNYNHDYVRRLHGRGINKLRELFADRIADM